MFEILSAGSDLPVDAVGWTVLLLSLVVTAVWIRYLYR